MDGPYTPPEQPSLKLYDDEEGNEVLLQEVAGLPMLFFEMKAGLQKSGLETYQKILLGVEMAIKEEGLDRYYILVGSQKDYDYAIWMGYQPTDSHLANTQYEILEKIL